VAYLKEHDYKAKQYNQSKDESRKPHGVGFTSTNLDPLVPHHLGPVHVVGQKRHAEPV